MRNANHISIDGKVEWNSRFRDFCLRYLLSDRLEILVKDLTATLVYPIHRVPSSLGPRRRTLYVHVQVDPDYFLHKLWRSIRPVNKKA
jgi:hypothetical protein